MKLLVWIFVMRVLMVVTSIAAYIVKRTRLAKAKYEQADEMDFEKPLTSLVWLTSIISVVMTYLASLLFIRDWAMAHVVEAGDDHHLRNAGRGDYSRTGEDLHVHQFQAR